MHLWPLGGRALHHRAAISARATVPSHARATVGRWQPGGRRCPLLARGLILRLKGERRATLVDHCAAHELRRHARVLVVRKPLGEKAVAQVVAARPQEQSGERQEECRHAGTRGRAVARESLVQSSVTHPSAERRPGFCQLVDQLSALQWKKTRPASRLQ